MAAKAPAKLTAVVAKGDQRTSLEALRDTLADEIERPLRAGETSKPIAALSKQLVDVIAKLAALPSPERKSAVDELAKRRASRRATASVSKQPGPRVKRGTGSGRASS